MRSPARAIAWEMCARNWWHLVLAFGPLLFCAVVVQNVVPPGPPQGRESVPVMQTLSCLMTFVTLIWISSFTENDTRGRFGGFPSWMYTLPLRTASLVLLPMVFGTLLMAAAVGLWEWNICHYWKLHLEPDRLGWNMLVAVTTLVGAQAVIWSSYRFRWFRIVLLVAVIYGGLFAAIYPQSVEFPGGRAIWFAGAGLAFIAALVASVLGVERDRRGEWKGWTTKLIDSVLDRLPRRSGAFASGARAGFWFEWRRRGFFMSTCFAMPAAMTLLILPLPTGLYFPEREVLVALALPFWLLLFALGTIGGTLGKSDPWSTELAVHPIVATKPRDTCSIVFSKMQAALGMVLLGFAVAAVLSVPAIAWCNHANWPNEQAQRYWPDFAQTFPRLVGWLLNPVVILAIVAVVWHTIIGGMSVTLSGSRGITWYYTARTVVMWSAAISAAIWLLQHPSDVDALLPFLPFVSAAILLQSAIATVTAFLAIRPLVSRRQFGVLAGLWVATALLVAGAGISASLAGGAMPSAVAWLLIALFCFPGAAIPACISALHRNRHR